MFDVYAGPFRKPRAPLPEIVEPVWVRDREDYWCMKRLQLRDRLRYGFGHTYRYMTRFREREAYNARLERDPVLRKAVRECDDAKHARGYGVTSCGYIVGSAGDFI